MAASFIDIASTAMPDHRDVPDPFAPGRSIGRNERCPCGSGRRHKTCCGRDAKVVARMQAAMLAQRAGALDEARALYGEVLARAPELPDALHMLGLIDLTCGDLDSALPRLLASARRFGDAWLPARQSLGTAVAAAHGVRAMQQTRSRWFDARLASAHGGAPGGAPPVAGGSVSVVIPSYNHARYLGEAIASVFAQTRPADEVIVIDDGSTDGSADVLASHVRERPGAIRLITRENRGAAATINEAIGLAGGEWINILNSDDRFPPHRLATMHAAIAGTGADWGYSRVDFVDDAGRAIAPGTSDWVDAHRRLIDGVGACDSVGLAFLEGNRAISSGALYFRRSLWQALGGFADLRYNHDWDFCLRATRLSEPRFVATPSYDYRCHGRNTILESRERARAECDAMFRRWYGADRESGRPGSPLAPSSAVWGDLYAVRAIGAGHAALLPPGTIERLAERAIAGAHP